MRGYYAGSFNEPGVLLGAMRDDVLDGMWEQNGRRGPFRFVFLDAARFAGAWEVSDGPGGRWDGARSLEP